jgi:hypothetical protein
LTVKRLKLKSPEAVEKEISTTEEVIEIEEDTEVTGTEETLDSGVVMTEAPEEILVTDQRDALTVERMDTLPETALNVRVL